MSDEKEMPLPSEAPPVYPMPVPAYPPLKDETPPYISPTRTVPPPPVPAPAASISGRQYQEHVLASCAAGHHDPTTKFGTCGIITAICCFPIGLLCLCADRETRCARCGVLLY